ncbi:MAG: thioesterase family protein [Acidimicrobiales bacterium]
MSSDKKSARADGQLRISDLTFTDLMNLEPHGPDTFVGLSPRYPWGGRLFGGQVVAQALRAAQSTVDEEYAVHSIHSYFIRGGTPSEPVRFEVDRIRNGRSFITRRAVARQSNGAILNLSASFQKAEEAPDVQPHRAPSVPRPEVLDDTGWGDMLQRRRAVEEFGRTVTWVRLSQDIEDDPRVAACAFLFISDSVPTGAVRPPTPNRPTTRARATSSWGPASITSSTSTGPSLPPTGYSPT